MNLTPQEIEACRKASAYYAALADGKKVEVLRCGLLDEEYHTLVDATDFLEGWAFRIIEPPKLRPYREDELHELLGMKIRSKVSRSVFLFADTTGEHGEFILKNWTFFDGPNAGQPVGKVDA